MAKSFTDMEELTADPSINSSSSSVDTSKPKKTIQSVLLPQPPLYAVAPALARDDEEYKSVFIDTLTVNDEHGEPIPGAAEKVQAMRDMRFKPSKRYAEQNARDALRHEDPTSAYYTTNGVRFLKPMADPNVINFKDFNKSSGLKVIDQRTPWQSFVRGVSMFFQTLFTGGLGGIRLIAKMKQILPGTFGYAMNYDGDIEIYPANSERRIGLSPWTDIQIASINAPYVNVHNRLHLVNVPEGKYATATMMMEKEHPVLLGPGRYLIESQNFSLVKDDKGVPKYHDMNSSLIKHGDSYIVRVPQGKVAFGDLSGQPQIFEPEHGPYIFHDPTFKFAKEGNENFLGIGDKLVNKDGPVRVVTVMQTHAVLSTENGELKIHRGGRHPLVNANHVCHPDKPNQEIDLTQQKIPIADGKEVFISADGVQLQVSADMLFRVKDLEKCIKKVGADDYRFNITASAKHIIRELLKSSNYLNTGDLHSKTNLPSESKELVVHDTEKAKEHSLQNIGSELRERLVEALNKEGGIELHDVLITNLLPLSAELRKSIESNANSIAEAQRKITEAELDQSIQTTKAETARRTATIEAERNAAVLKISTKATADAETIKQVGQATALSNATSIKLDAEMSIIKRTAETKAEATVKAATAEKEAHILRADGLKAYDDTGKQIQLLNAQAAASKDMLHGAELKLIGSSVGDIGNMMMSSIAGTLFTGRAPMRVLEHAAAQASAAADSSSASVVDSNKNKADL